MPYRNYVAFSDKEMRFAESDASIHHLRCARYNEQSVAILLELGLLVSLASILNRKRVQIKLLLNAIQQIWAGLEQADPNDMTGAVSSSAGLLDGDVCDALSFCICARCDDARFCRGGWKAL